MDALATVIAGVLALASACLALRVWRADLGVPWWNGGDTLFELMKVKSLLEHHSVLNNPDLGAPFGQRLHDFPDTKPLQYLFVWILGRMSSDPVVVTNLFFVLSFAMVAISAAVVLRLIGASVAVAVGCAVLFALLPYHFERNEQALFLGSYIGVPFGAYLVLVVMMGEWRLRAGSAAGRDRQWLVLAAACVAIGLLDLYYAVLTLLLVAGATLVRLAGTRTLRSVRDGAAIVGIIVALVIASLAPNIAYWAAHGRNPIVAKRGPTESEEFSLNLTSVTLPVEGHRVSALDRYQERVTQSSAVGHEPARIGLVASLGLAWLLLVMLACAFGSSRFPADPRQRLLAGGALMVVLLGTTGGISGLIAWGVTPQIRTWSRLAVFLAFFALAAVALLIDDLRRRAPASVRRWVGGPLVATIAILGLADQTSSAQIPDYAAASRRDAADASLARVIQNRLPRGALVFELPRVWFPESPPVGGVGAYELLRPYLQSRGLRWSFGAMRERAEDWSASLAGAGPDVLLPRIAAVGAAGLYIDRRAYGDRGARLERRVAQLIKATPIATPDGQASFFDLREYARASRHALSPALADLVGRDVLHPVRVDEGDSTVVLDPRDGDQPAWLATSQTSRLTLINPGDRSRAVVFSAILQRSDPAVPVELRFPGAPPARALVGADGVPVRRRLRLAPGRTTIAISTSGFPVPSGADQMQAFVRLTELMVERSSVWSIGRSPTSAGP